MKTLFSFLLILVAFTSKAQNLHSCETVDDVKSLIAGDWKLEGDSKNVIYRFSFSGDKGFIEVLKELNLPPKAETNNADTMIIYDHEIFNIVSKQSTFFISIQSLYYQIIEEIEVLNKSNFIYGRGNSRHIFIKDAI